MPRLHVQYSQQIKTHIPGALDELTNSHSRILPHVLVMTTRPEFEYTYSSISANLQDLLSSCGSQGLGACHNTGGTMDCTPPACKGGELSPGVDVLTCQYHFGQCQQILLLRWVLSL